MTAVTPKNDLWWAKLCNIAIDLSRYAKKKKRKNKRNAFLYEDRNLEVGFVVCGEKKKEHNKQHIQVKLQLHFATTPKTARRKKKKIR